MPNTALNTYPCSLLPRYNWGLIRVIVHRGPDPPGPQREHAGHRVLELSRQRIIGMRR